MSVHHKAGSIILAAVVFLGAMAAFSDNKADQAELAAKAPAPIIGAASIPLAACTDKDDAAAILHAIRDDADSAASVVAAFVHSGACRLMSEGDAAVVVQRQGDLVEVRQVDALRGLWVPSDFLASLP